MKYKTIQIAELLHLRYKPNKLNFIGCPKNEVFNAFDWVLWTPDSKRSIRLKKSKPKTILCLANKKSFKLLNILSPFIKNAVIVIAGGDTRLSIFLDTIKPSVVNHNRIFYEAKDVDHPTIQSFSMGFNSFYLKDVGWDHIQRIVKNFEHGNCIKTGVLAAWGKHWPALDSKLQDRKNADQFLQSCPFIQRQQLEPLPYWEKLAQSVFLLAPYGQGVQAPKLAEAWLVGTVPIVTKTPCFEDLKKMGFPLIIVNCWNDITETHLQQWEAQIKSIDWDAVRTKLTNKHFLSMVHSKLPH